MPEIQTQIEIDTPPDTVWRILADFPAYPDWNPFVTSIEGRQTVGERLTARYEPPDSRATTQGLTLRHFEPGVELRWLGHLGSPYIFYGEHSVRLEANATGGTTVHHSEHFGGVLAVPLLWLVRKNTERGFEAMNTALKARAESSPA